MMNKNANMLLAILQDHAPTGTAQQKCTEMYLDMQKGGLSGNELEGALASALVDGLYHGNWPWTEGMIPKKA